MDAIRKKIKEVRKKANGGEDQSREEQAQYLLARKEYQTQYIKLNEDIDGINEDLAELGWVQIHAEESPWEDDDAEESDPE
eukprot:4148474-Heterocapsa_arctica.AAC.1